MTQAFSLVKDDFAVLFCIQMQSKRKTPVSVLRQELGLSVARFARLIGKSIVTVNSLETGRLKLSKETAYTISRETGVSMDWLLAGKPKREPYFFDDEGNEQLYRKERYEQVQSLKIKKPALIDPALRFVLSNNIASNWHSVFSAAVGADRGEFAAYLMREFLAGLVERLGKDDEAFLRLNAGTRVSLSTGEKFKWARPQDIGIEGDGMMLVPDLDLP